MSKQWTDSVTFQGSGDGEAIGPSTETFNNSVSPSILTILNMLGGTNQSFTVPTDAGGNRAKVLVLSPLGTVTGNLYLGSGGASTGFTADPTQTIRLPIPSGVTSITLQSQNAITLRAVWG